MMGMCQSQMLKEMPNGMAKQIILKIINGPKAPVEQLEKEAREYDRIRLAEWAEEERLQKENK